MGYRGVEGTYDTANMLPEYYDDDKDKVSCPEADGLKIPIASCLLRQKDPEIATCYGGCKGGHKKRNQHHEWAYALNGNQLAFLALQCSRGTLSNTVIAKMSWKSMPAVEELRNRWEESSYADRKEYVGIVRLPPYQKAYAAYREKVIQAGKELVQQWQELAAAETPQKEGKLHKKEEVEDDNS